MFSEHIDRPLDRARNFSTGPVERVGRANPIAGCSDYSLRTSPGLHDSPQAGTSRRWQSASTAGQRDNNAGPGDTIGKIAHALAVSCGTHASIASYREANN